MSDVLPIAKDAWLYTPYPLLSEDNGLMCYMGRDYFHPNCDERVGNGR